MKKTLLSFVVLLAAMAVQAQTVMKVSVSNPLSVSRNAVPVTIQLDTPVRSALVVDSKGVELPCQLDDIDSDGRNEETPPDKSRDEDKHFHRENNERNRRTGYGEWLGELCGL